MDFVRRLADSYGPVDIQEDVGDLPSAVILFPETPVIPPSLLKILAQIPFVQAARRVQITPAICESKQLTSSLVTVRVREADDNVCAEMHHASVFGLGIDAELGQPLAPTVLSKRIGHLAVLGEEVLEVECVGWIYHDRVERVHIVRNQVGDLLLLPHRYELLVDARWLEPFPSRLRERMSREGVIDGQKSGAEPSRWMWHVN